MESLPMEVQLHICKYVLHPPDLANLARTSSLFLPSARWVLYQNLELTSSLPSLQDVYSLLRREPDLARAVTSLKLVCIPGHQPLFRCSAWIDQRMFSMMVALQSITLDGIPCAPEHYIRKIIVKVYKCCPKLEEVSIVNVARPVYSTRTPNPPFKLDVPSTLRRVTFKCPSSSAYPTGFFHLTFFNAPSAINVLSLSLRDCANVLNDIESLKFPQLRTFSASGFSSIASNGMLEFLAAHPSIRNLSLLDSDSLNISGTKTLLLPNLDTISSTPDFLAQLIKVCGNVQFVRCLTLDFSRSEPYTFWTVMAEIISTISDFPRLKHCSILHLYGPDTLRLLEAFPECPELEWWTGGFYYHDHHLINEISSILASFPRLSRVDIYEWSTPPDVMSAIQLKGFQNMAECSPFLQKICLYMPHSSTSEIAGVFNITKERTLKKIYQYIENEPHIGDRRLIDFDAVDWRIDPLLYASVQRS